MDSAKEEAPLGQTTLSQWKAFRKRSIFQAILVGALVGISIVAFRFLLSFLDSQRLALYRLLSQQVAFIPLWLLVLLILGVFSRLDGQKGSLDKRQRYTSDKSQINRISEGELAYHLSI